MANLRKKTLALMGATCYRSVVGLPEEDIPISSGVYASEDQADRVEAGQVEAWRKPLRTCWTRPPGKT